MPIHTDVNLLDKVIISLSETDHLDLRSFVAGGTLIVGDSGSGKSSTSTKQIICAFMRAGLGGLLTTTKPGDAEEYVSYARECGREGDVLVFSEDSGHTFDPLAYEWSRKTGRGAGMVEACIDFFSTLMNINKPQGDSADRFWELSAQVAMRAAILLLKLASEPVSLINIARTIASFPKHPDEQESDTWKGTSFTGSLIEAIRKRKASLTEEQWGDLETATEAAFTAWANLDPRTRGSIQATLDGLFGKFMYQPMKRIFASGEFSFEPSQMTHNGLIVILDFPINEYGRETATLIQVMVKLTCQRAWLRHKFSPDCCNGAFLVQDEFQLLTSGFESFFVQTARSSGLALVGITQSILGLAEKLGEHQPGSKTKAFLNNLTLKIAHRTTCQDTANYFSEIVGKVWKFIPNYGQSTGESGRNSISTGGSRQYVSALEPVALSKLERPSSSSPISVAVVFRGGDHFNATQSEENPEGSNFMYVAFTR